MAGNFKRKREERVIMTNAAAVGYMIRAAKQTELEDKVIKILEVLMLEEMDFHTEKEAEETYYSY